MPFDVLSWVCELWKFDNFKYRCKNLFYVFFIFLNKKRVFNVFYCLNFFYFPVPNFFSTKPTKFLDKTTFK